MTGRKCKKRGCTTSQRVHKNTEYCRDHWHEPAFLFGRKKKLSKIANRAMVWGCESWWNHEHGCSYRKQSALRSVGDSVIESVASTVVALIQGAPAQTQGDIAVLRSLAKLRYVKHTSYREGVRLIFRARGSRKCFPKMKKHPSFALTKISGHQKVDETTE